MEWCYLYRIVDKDGDSIFFHLSKTRDHRAALACVRGAIRVAGFVPDKINSDGSSANELTMKFLQANPEFVGPVKAQIRYTKVKYLNNMIG